jgi:hypothetical protein
MILPCCFKDTIPNREIAKGLIDNHFKTKGKQLILISINNRLQVLTEQSIESLRQQNKQFTICQ